ncbi:MAG: TonB family protein [Desulfobacterales bacterium]
MTRLLLSIVLALAIHGLIFCFDGEWLKKEQHRQARPSPVAISLTHLPPVNTATNPKPQKKIEKYGLNIRENQSVKKERVSELQVSKPEQPAISTRPDVFASSVVTEDSLPSPIGKGNTEGDSKKKSEGSEPSNDQMAGEMQSVLHVVKEAVPLYKANHPPVYPLQAKKRGFEGIVILEVLVTKEGNAGKVSVFKSSHYSLLDEAAVSSVKKWRFEPGKKGDKIVDMPVKIPIRFKLEGD